MQGNRALALTLILFFASPAYANLSIEVTLPGEVITGLEYGGPFKITREDYQQGDNITANVTLIMTLTSDGRSTNSTVFVEGIKWYTKSKTGSVIFPKPGNYTLCGDVGSDIACSNITAIDTSTIPCEASIRLKLPRKVYFEGETVEFVPELENDTLFSFGAEIEYWIEDLFGNHIKNSFVTKNNNPKKWKAKAEEADAAYLLKARISSLRCNDTDIKDDYAEEIFAVVGAQEEKPYLDLKLDKTEYDWGSTAKATITANRGASSKKTVKVSALGETSSITLAQKYTEYEISVPILMGEPCGNTTKITVTAQGLGLSSTEETTLKPGNKCFPTPKKLTGYNFSLTPVSSRGSEVTSEIVLHNNEDIQMDVDIYSYVYRGSKSYSGEREYNMMRIRLGPFETRSVELVNNVNESGNFSVKALAREKGRKTWKEIRSWVMVTLPKKNTAAVIESPEPQVENDSEPLPPPLPDEMPAGVVFESSSIKAKKNIYYLFLLTLMAALLAALWH